MRNFESRSPRFSVDFPVRLTIKNTTLTGRCREISKQGMRVELRHPLAPNARGTLSMSHKDETLELNVRVAHDGATQKGLGFIYESDNQRHAVERLIGSLAAGPSRPGPAALR